MKKNNIALVLIAILLGTLLFTSTMAYADTRELHVLRLTIGSKNYDGTVYPGSVSITTRPSLSSVGDVAINFKAWYEDANVGTNKRITVKDISLSGSDAGNYTLFWDAPTVYYANIYARKVNIISTTADGKEYDGTTTTKAYFILEGNYISDQDIVTVAGDADFITADAGVDKTVVVSNLKLEGDPAVVQNYTLTTTSTTATATIRPKSVSVTEFSVKDKVYDGQTAAQVDVEYEGIISGEDVSVTADGTYWDSTWSRCDPTPGIKNVQISDVVFSGTGNASNYVLSIDTDTEIKANILPKEVTVRGITALSKTEDGTVNATLDASGALVTGLLNGETVEVEAEGEFEDAKPGINKKVLIKSITLSGNDAGNYNLAQSGNQTETYASIIEDPDLATGKSFMANGLKYKITTKNSAVTFIGLQKAKSKSSVTIPATVKYKNVTFKVTAIAAKALKNDQKIKKLIIGTNVKAIGKSAFQGCEKLKAITIKTRLLTSSSVKSNSFKQINKKATITCPSGMKNTYKKILLKKGAPKTCKFK